MCSFHDPTMSPQSLRRLNAFACDARRDAAPPQCLSLLFGVICFISVQLRGTFARASHRLLDGTDRINSFFHHLDVMNIRRRDGYGERDTSSFDHKVAFRALFAAIRRILPGFIAPFCAATADESSDARDQSMRSASPNRSSRALCNRFHTPASCHSFNLRQQVMPEPQPISGGRYSHGNPVANTKRMPRRTSRFGIRGLPPLGFSGSGGNKGSMTAHSSSVINFFAMLYILHGKLRFC